MAFLLDSNIIIYSFRDDYGYLRSLLDEDNAYVSEISRLEALGYHKLKDKRYFRDIFDLIPIIFPSQDIYNKAIEVRRQYNLKLGDSIIAATGLIHNLPLYSRNTIDFGKIKGLKCINPVK